MSRLHLSAALLWSVVCTSVLMWMYFSTLLRFEGHLSASRQLWYDSSHPPVSGDAYRIPVSCDLPFGPAARYTMKNNISVLLINVHFGVANEVEGALRALETNFTITHDRGVPVADYVVTQQASDEWWHQHSNLCDEYDFVISGDTAPLARPMFEHCHNAVVVGLITNRYDWAIPDDRQYDAMMAAASKRPNVRMVQNNLFEQFHAKVLKQADIFFSAYIPSAGIPSQLAVQVFDSLDVTEKQRPLDDSEILVVDHTTTGRDHAEREVIISFLGKQANANLRVLQPAHYGGPLGLQNRVLLHIPYQSNTMALFENLGVNVIYLLPSLRLYRSWGHEQALGHQVRMAGHRPYELPENVYLKYVDWYRSDLQHLFYYFDTLEDLLPSSKLRQQIAQEATTKRTLIQTHMGGHKQCVMNQWKQLFASSLPYSSNEATLVDWSG